MNIEKTLRIDAAPEKLWPLLVEFENLRRWNPDMVSEQRLTTGPPGVGSRSHVMIREGGKEVEYSSEVLAFEPGKTLVTRLTGGNLGAGPMDVSYEIAPGPDHLTLRMAARWKPVGLALRMMAPVIEVAAKRNFAAAAARLKALAEEE